MGSTRSVQVYQTFKVHFISRKKNFVGVVVEITMNHAVFLVYEKSSCN